MAIEQLNNPAVEYIHSLAPTPQARRELETVTRTLRRRSSRSRSVGRDPQVSQDVFTGLLRPLPQLDGQVPLVTLAQAVAKERGRQLPDSVRVQVKDGPLAGKASTLFVRDKLTDDLPPTSAIVRDGDLFLSRRKLQKGKYLIGIPKAEREQVLAQIPSLQGHTINTIPIDLYNVAAIAEKKAELARAQERAHESKPSQTEALDPSVWIDSYRLGAIYGLTANNVKKILRGQSIGSTKYQRKLFFLRDQAGETLTHHLAQTQAVEGIYYRDGQSVVTPFYIKNRFDIGYKAIKTLLTPLLDAPVPPGKTTYYPLESAVDTISEFLALPKIDTADGIYNDEKGKRWVIANTAKDLLHISPQKLNQFVKGVDKLSVRSKNNAPAVAYDYDAILQKGADYLKIPMEENLTPQDMLVDVGDLSDEFNLPVDTVRSVIRPLGVSVRGAGIVKKYPRERAEEVLHAFLQFPEIDRTKNEVVHSSGGVFVSKAEARRRNNLRIEQLDALLTQAPIGFVIARSGTGFYQLFSLDDITAAHANAPKQTETYVDLGELAYGPEGKGKRLSWQSMDEEQRRTLIEMKAEMLTSRGVRLTVSSLRAAGENSFPDQVNQHYRGGMSALASLCGPVELAVGVTGEYVGGLRKFHEALGLVPVEERQVPDGNVKRIKWREMTTKQRKMTIEERARELAAAGVKLTTRDLSVAGAASFPSQVKLHYPGGMEALRKKVGQKDVVQKKIQWQKKKDIPLAMRREVAKIVKNNQGKLSTMDLREAGLLSSIHDLYPGGYQQLRVDLGLNKQRKALGEWTPEKIRADVQAIIDAEGSFSSGVAVRLGRVDLLNALTNHYDGGIPKILKDLGKKPNRRTWTEPEIEAEALAVYLEHERITTSLLDTVKGLSNATFKKYPGGIQALRARVIELVHTLG